MQFFVVILCQVQLLSPMQLTSNHLSPLGPLSIPSNLTSQTSGASDGDAAYVSNYIPLYPGQVAPNNQAIVSPVPQPLSPDSLAQCLSGPDVASATTMVPSPAMSDSVSPSVITHTACSTVTASDAATTFSQGTEYGSMSALPLPSQLPALASLSAASIQQPQTFAVPRPFRPPSSSKNKNPPVQRITITNTLPSSHVFLTGR